MPADMTPVSSTDRSKPVPISMQPVIVPDAVAKDAIMGWYRSEFAASNAIIDLLCGHLSHLGGSEYNPLFAAIHQRRLNWIPVLQMQKYHSIADVALEIRRLAAVKPPVASDAGYVIDEKMESQNAENVMETNGNGEIEAVEDVDLVGDSQELQPIQQNMEICSNHKDCKERSELIKLTKGFTAKEHVKGHMVNVVKGLKLYEDAFSDSEINKISDFVNELRVAGQNGELLGDTFVLFNKQIKGNKRELIQFGVPIYGHIKDETMANNNMGNLEPIPYLLQSVIDHLVQWEIVPELKRPNSCTINFFDEGGHSTPFLKPPHLEQPILTLFLTESTMAMGRSLMSDNDGNYKGPLMFSLRKGSVLVMRGNSAELARHVMCPCPNNRVTITFFRVRLDSNHVHSPPLSPFTTDMTAWQPTMPIPYKMPDGDPNTAIDMSPNWGVVQAPMVMFSSVIPMATSLSRIHSEGTGVFLPWAAASPRKPTRHLPPRAQKTRYVAVHPALEESEPESSVAATCASVEENSMNII